MRRDVAPFFAALGYVIVLGTSLWLAVRFGGSWQGKMGLFVVVCLAWWLALGALRARLAGEKAR